MYLVCVEKTYVRYGEQYKVSGGSILTPIASFSLEKTADKFAGKLRRVYNRITVVGGKRLPHDPKEITAGMKRKISTLK